MFIRTKNTLSEKFEAIPRIANVTCEGHTKLDLNELDKGQQIFCLVWHKFW